MVPYHPNTRISRRSSVRPEPHASLLISQGIVLSTSNPALPHHKGKYIHCYGDPCRRSPGSGFHSFIQLNSFSEFSHCGFSFTLQFFRHSSMMYFGICSEGMWWHISMIYWYIPPICLSMLRRCIRYSRNLGNIVCKWRHTWGIKLALMGLRRK